MHTFIHISKLTHTHINTQILSYIHTQDVTRHQPVLLRNHWHTPLEDLRPPICRRPHVPLESYLSRNGSRCITSTN